MAKSAGGRKTTKKLDPETQYSPAQLMVSTERTLPPSQASGALDRLPAREAIYRTLQRRGPMTVADLAAEFGAMTSAGARPPYAEDPALYVVRMIGGGGRSLPPLASFDALVHAFAVDPAPDPDYGFELLPA